MPKTKYVYDVREIDAWREPEGWTWNDSFHMGYMTTCAKNEKRALTAYLRRAHGIRFKLNRTLIDSDGDVIEIRDRKTGEPIIAAILTGET